MTSVGVAVLVMAAIGTTLVAAWVIVTSARRIRVAIGEARGALEQLEPAQAQLAEAQQVLAREQERVQTSLDGLQASRAARRSARRR